MTTPKSAAESELSDLLEQDDEWIDEDVARARELRKTIKTERADAERRAAQRPRESVAGDSDRDGRGHEQAPTGQTASEVMATRALKGGRW